MVPASESPPCRISPEHKILEPPSKLKAGSLRAACGGPFGERTLGDIWAPLRLRNGNWIDPQRTRRCDINYQHAIGRRRFHPLLRARDRLLEVTLRQHCQIQI